MRRKVNSRPPKNKLEETLIGLTHEGFEYIDGIEDTLSESEPVISRIRPIIRKHFRKSKSISTVYGSYKLKHRMEEYNGEPGKDYVTNGKLIYAMALEGFRMKREGKNCYFNIYVKDYREVEAICQSYRNAKMRKSLTR